MCYQVTMGAAKGKGCGCLGCVGCRRWRIRRGRTAPGRCGERLGSLRCEKENLLCHWCSPHQGPAHAPHLPHVHSTASSPPSPAAPRETPTAPQAVDLPPTRLLVPPPAEPPQRWLPAALDVWFEKEVKSAVASFLAGEDYSDDEFAS